MKRASIGWCVVLAACGQSDGLVSALDQQGVPGISWDDFIAHHAFREPGTGVWIADGDTPFANGKQLREFYEKHVRYGQLIVNQVGGADDRWNDVAKHSITYCVSDTFGDHKPLVVSAMTEATSAWSKVADVQFVHLAEQDATCDANNQKVVFDVNPTDVQGAYLARAFFPSQSRETRNVLIDNTAFTAQGIPMAGVLRHELGHTLGFRHEHTRPEAGTCFEDNSWRALTVYDSASVMHYPQCNGTNTWELLLSPKDAEGAAALYGAALTSDGGGVGGGDAGTGGAGGGDDGGSTGGGAGGGLATDGGNTSGGDAGAGGGAGGGIDSGDSGVGGGWGGGSPDDGGIDSGDSGVGGGWGGGSPDDAGSGGGSSTGDAGTGGGNGGGSGDGGWTSDGGTGGGAGQSVVFTGTVVQNEIKPYGPFIVAPGSLFTARLTSSTGDADLYLRFMRPPTGSAYDCRPFLEGSPSEVCSVSVPRTSSAVYINVVGFSAASYTLTIEYVPDTHQDPGGTPKSAAFDGSVAANQEQLLAPFTVVPGSTFSVVMSGTGEPDLYVRMGAAPTATVFDCRPFVGGANESCLMQVPATATSAYVMVRGYHEGTYHLNVDYFSP